MKSILTFSLAVSLTLPLASAAFATPLPVGPTPVTPSAVSSFAGVEMGMPFAFDFSNANETGSVTEEVFNDNGTFNFYYQVTDNAGSTDALSRLTVGDFAGATTDVNYIFNTASSEGSTVDIAPFSVTRNSSDIIGFNFFVGPGQTSDWLEISTNAMTLAAGTINVTDGLASSTDQAMGPGTDGMGSNSVPEPSTWALILASAAGGIIYSLRRQQVSRVT